MSKSNEDIDYEEFDKNMEYLLSNIDNFQNEQIQSLTIEVENLVDQNMDRLDNLSELLTREEAEDIQKALDDLQELNKKHHEKMLSAIQKPEIIQSSVKTEDIYIEPELENPKIENGVTIEKQSTGGKLVDLGPNPLETVDKMVLKEMLSSIKDVNVKIDKLKPQISQELASTEEAVSKEGLDVYKELERQAIEKLQPLKNSPYSNQIQKIEVKNDFLGKREEQNKEMKDFTEQMKELSESKEVKVGKFKQLLNKIKILVETVCSVISSFTKKIKQVNNAEQEFTMTKNPMHRDSNMTKNPAYSEAVAIRQKLKRDDNRRHSMPSVQTANKPSHANKKAKRRKSTGSSLTR